MFKKRDPVCGAKVDKGVGYFLRYNGRVYYFDSGACKATFEKEPGRFIGENPDKGFLGWLARGADGVPKSCHECNEKNR